MNYALEMRRGNTKLDHQNDDFKKYLLRSTLCLIALLPT
ncbi:hypothetical protein CFter6_2566 [Collimonas fungivorans]|uniref:Uncharacterized protein n=1 Tax=Collimonas fungivorans TaxID=158899 RepID=A0A127PBN7_9BURK|nr:hypothetical protein CFter6_2566 [Collimonas fungivorans]